MLSGRIPFNRVSIERCTLNCSGVYVFWYHKVCIYVGKTDRMLRKRLFEHWSDSHNPALKRWIKAYGRNLEIQWEEVRDINQIRMYEQKYIDILKPIANIMSAEKKT